MKKAILVCACLVVLGLPALATAQQFFDFFGQADLPAAVGDPLTLHAVVRPPVVPITNPLPLDFANYEYTLVIEGLLLVSDGSTQLYSGGTLTLFEDAATAADHANGATFVDGTALLVGNVPNLTRSVLLGTLGTVTGTVDWTGGTRLGELAPADQSDWTFVSGTNSDPSGVEPGYDDAWDGKLEPQEPVVEVLLQSWGSLKGDF